jgi:hypothetical protein
MFPDYRILRTARNLSLFGVLLSLAALGPGCTASPSTAPTPPAVTSQPVSYNEFADLQYFLMQGTNTVAIELFDGRTTITDIHCDLQTGGPAPVLRVRIWGNVAGVETKKILWDTEGNAIYYVDVGNVDKSKLQVVYEDDQGRHDLSLAGVRDGPFEAEHPSATKPATPNP